MRQSAFKEQAPTPRVITSGEHITTTIHISRSLLRVSLALTAVFVSFISRSTEASCLLSFDSARVVSQGDGIARFSLQGGAEGFGTHLEGRLGLPGDRSIHLRTGTCQQSSLWGWALEAGVNQSWLSVEETGLVDLGFRITATMLLADKERDNAYSSAGLQSVFLVSLPFTLAQASDNETERRGFVALSLGLTSEFIDRRERKTIEREDSLLIEQLSMTSDVSLQPLIAASAAVDIIQQTPLSLELRWQRNGLYGGAAVSYLF